MTEIISEGITITIPLRAAANWDQVMRNVFLALSGHDHTGSGNGVQIGTNAIANEAVTEAKLHADAATRSTIIMQTGAGDDIPSGTAAATSIHFDGFGGVFSAAIKVPKPCKITHLSFSIPDSVDSGTFTVTLYKNGATTSQSVAIASGNGGYGAITAVSFAAGDILSLRQTRASVVFNGGSSGGINAVAWGHFTE